MKRPSEALYLRQWRIAGWRASERARRKSRAFRAPHERYVPPSEIVVAPRRFDLTRGSGAHLGRFLRAVAHRVLVQKQPVRLDFRETESFYPAGTILLFAELDRIISSSGLPKPVTVVQPRARLPREVLKQIGIFALTGDSCDLVPTHRDVVFWRSVTGSTGSGDELAQLADVAVQVNEQHPQQLVVADLWRGVSEAVGNSVEHAYLFARSDGFAGLPNKRWWMFTQLRDNMFTVAVCDMGCGYQATIRQTIPASFVASIKDKLQGVNPDARAIQTAMEFGNSGTGHQHRGKGSRDALSVLRKHGQGELLVTSNTGWVRYIQVPGMEPSVTYGSLETDIRGTIIWWKLSLSESVGG